MSPMVTPFVFITGPYSRVYPESLLGESTYILFTAGRVKNIASQKDSDRSSV